MGNWGNLEGENGATFEAARFYLEGCPPRLKILETALNPQGRMLFDLEGYRFVTKLSNNT